VKGKKQLGLFDGATKGSDIARLSKAPERKLRAVAAGLTREAERLLENFEVVAEVPGGVNRLRELILELAVRGRLVRQNPKDDPASALLEKIQDFKDRHGTRGRRRAALDEEYVNSVPYEAPAQWEWRRLDDVALKIQYGTSARPYEQPVGFPILRMNNIRNGRLALDNLKYVSRDAEGVSDLMLSDGDILFNRTNSYELVGKAAVFVEAPQLAGGCTFASYLISVSLTKEFLLPTFINMFFATSVCRKTQIEPGITQQTGQANFSGGKLRNVWVPVPPLVEQKRIVAKVDELMKLCDDLEARQTKQRETADRLNKAALDALTSAEGPEELAASWRRVAGSFDALLNRPESVKELRASVLDLAVRGRLVSQEGQPSRSLHRTDKELFPVPSTWAWARIGDEFDVVGGIQKTPLRAPRSHHYPYLRVENVQRGHLNLERIERFEVDGNELERWRLMPGDILVVEGNGSATEIGRCAIWNGAIENCVHQNHIIRCRPVGGVSSPFALLFLNSPTGMAEMRQLAITTSGLYSLSVGKIRGIILPVPPLPEQKRIVAKVDELMKLCDALEDALRRAEDTAKNLADALVAELLA